LGINLVDIAGLVGDGLCDKDVAVIGDDPVVLFGVVLNSF